MNKLTLSRAIAGEELIQFGIGVEFDESNPMMKLYVSDKKLEKFKCELLEEDYPKVFPNTCSLLVLQLSKSYKSLKDPISVISTEQHDQLIFGYFEHEILSQIGVTLKF